MYNITMNTILRLQPVRDGLLQVPFSKHVVTWPAGFSGMYPGLQLSEQVSLNLLLFLSPQRKGFSFPLSGRFSGGQ